MMMLVIIYAEIIVQIVYLVISSYLWGVVDSEVTLAMTDFS
jgi:hypothetical protein